MVTIVVFVGRSSSSSCEPADSISCRASSALVLSTLKGSSDVMAMPRPKAVAMSASAMPPVIAPGAPRSPPMSENEPIMPVTVPSRPSRGANVMTVSRMAMPRLKRLSSCASA